MTEGDDIARLIRLRDYFTRIGSDIDVKRIDARLARKGITTVHTHPDLPPRYERVVRTDHEVRHEQGA